MQDEPSSPEATSVGADSDTAPAMFDDPEVVAKDLADAVKAVRVTHLFTV